MLRSSILSRVLPIVAVAMLVSLGYAVLTVKTQVRELKKDIIKVSRAIGENKKNLHILKTEWEYLNAPERLKVLSERYLSLKAASAMQVQTGAGVFGSGFFLSLGRHQEHAPKLERSAGDMAQVKPKSSADIEVLSAVR